jgi:Spy/CpxP family protein refolding chaperone
MGSFEVTMRINVKNILPLFVALLILSVSGQARSFLPQDPQTDSGPGMQTRDPITQLNLTPEQRQKIRTIREQTKNERAAINQQVRESNFALQQALDADNPDEAVVEQRLRDVAAAQAAATRMRVLTEVRIRRVLTPEQVNTWRTLRQQASEIRREQRLENARPNRQGASDPRPLPNQQNGLAPFLQRRRTAHRNPRP